MTSAKNAIDILKLENLRLANEKQQVEVKLKKQFLKTYDERTELAEKTTIEDISENIASYTKNNKH